LSDAIGAQFVTLALDNKKSRSFSYSFASWKDISIDNALGVKY
jgi:hypothetical protein